jgi:hypothetical protein
MMAVDRFWEILEATIAPTREEQLERFKVELQRLSVTDLVEFTKRFFELKDAVYDWDLWLVVWLCRGGMCSDDGFTYFRSWLLSRGRALYERARQDPDGFVEDLAQVENPFFETFDYALGDIYREKVTREIGDTDVPHRSEPGRGDWLRPELKDRSGSHMLNLCVVFKEMGDPEFAEIERRFPRLWQHCLAKGIIKVYDPNAPPQESEPPLPSPEEIARSKVDPNLANTDFGAYLHALAKAAREEYQRRRIN